MAVYDRLMSTGITPLLREWFIASLVRLMVQIVAERGGRGAHSATGHRQV